jgi:hypothetical protein
MVVSRQRPGFGPDEDHNSCPTARVVGVFTEQRPGFGPDEDHNFRDAYKGQFHSEQRPGFGPHEDHYHPKSPRSHLGTERAGPRPVAAGQAIQPAPSAGVRRGLCGWGGGRESDPPDREVLDHVSLMTVGAAPRRLRAGGASAKIQGTDRGETVGDHRLGPDAAGALLISKVDEAAGQAAKGPVTGGGAGGARTHDRRIMSPLL